MVKCLFTITVLETTSSLREAQRLMTENRVTISYLFLSTLLLSSEQLSGAFEGVVWNVWAPDSGSFQLILFIHGSHVYKRVNFIITLKSGLSMAVRGQREQAAV